MGSLRRWATEQRARDGYARWIRATDLWLIGLAVVFLVALVMPLVEPNLAATTQRALTAVSTVIWVVFLLDYLVRLYLAPARWRFVRSHILDLIVIVLPLLRPLRVLRLIRLVQLVSLAGRVALSSRRTLQQRVALYVSGTAAIMLFVAAAAMLVVERPDPDSNIKTFPDALWWAAATVTTVGYGDRFPVTGPGRLVATGLMIVGIALLGVITASVAAWFVGNLQAAREDVEETVSDETTAVLAAIAAVNDRLDRLERRLDPTTDDVQTPHT
jgi:voltage-gated potassium channel